jgi:hypothetical protein
LIRERFFTPKVRVNLIAVPGRFDGFHAVTAAVSKTCLVSFDRNKYSVSSQAVGRPVEVQAYADRVVIRQDGAIVGEHERCFGRDQTVYDPWRRAGSAQRKDACLSSAGSLERSGMARHSRTGFCQHRWKMCGANCTAPTMATGRWWRSLPLC